MEVLNDYGAAKYYGVPTFTTGIFRTWTALEDLDSAIYLSAILICLVFLFVWFNKLLRGRKSYVTGSGVRKPTEKKRLNLKGRKKILYLSILLLPILFGFIIPIIQLIYWAYITFDQVFNLELFWIALQSFGLASGTALLIIICTFSLIYFSKWNQLQVLKPLTRMATIGYVIPGAIIGIGIMSISRFVVSFFENNFQMQIGYLFYGSAAVLIYAYIFRFLAVAYNPMEAHTLKIGKHLAESSYLLGKRSVWTLLRIEVPLLKTGIISAFFLVFIDLLKELPLTLILKPYKIQTLAVKSYEYADNEQVAEASLPALLLISMVGIVMIFINKWTKDSI